MRFTTIVVITTLFLVNHIKAQSVIHFVNGKKIIKISTSTIQSSTEVMEQKMEQNMTSTRKSEILITPVTEHEIKVVDKSLSIKMKMDVMGQEITYDTEKLNDNEQLFKLNDLINKETVITANAKGIITNIHYDSTIQAMLPMQPSFGGSSDYSIGYPLDFILQLPTDLVIGKTWNTIVGKDEAKTEYTYTIKSIEGDIINVNVFAKLILNQKGNAKGAEMTSNLTGEIKGNIWVNSKTNMVKMKTTTTALKGTMELNGKASAMEMKVTADDTYNY